MAGLEAVFSGKHWQISLFTIGVERENITYRHSTEVHLELLPPQLGARERSSFN
jgi:hypothetical protein